MTAKGYQFKNIKVDSGFSLPLKDTISITGLRPGSLTVRPQDSLLYMYNGKRWDLVAVDSTGLTAKIDEKVDSIKILGDTSYYYKKGVAYGSTFTVSNAYPTNFSFDSTTGTLTLQRNTLTPIDINLDGRYPLKIHYHYPSDITGLTTYTRNLFSSGSGIAYNPTTGSIAATGEAAITAPYTGLKYWTGFKTWGSLNDTIKTYGDLNYYPLSSNPSNYLTGNQSISFTPTGDVTGSATGATMLNPVLTIGAGKVTNAMLAGSIAASKLIGSDITLAQSQVTNLTTDLATKATDANVIHTTGNETKSGVLSLSSNPVFNSMTKGSIFFAGTGGQIRQNNTNLFWDSTSNQLEVAGTIAIKSGSNGMRWGYNATNHFTSLYPLTYGGGPTGFWNPATTSAANQNRTNVQSWFTMQRGFMMGTYQERSSNVLFDFSRYKPDATNYDIGDVFLNAGNTQWYDARPETILWKKISNSGSAAVQWVESKGYAEYSYTSTNATATYMAFTDVTGPGTTKYEISILAVNTATGETWSEERIYTFGASAGNTYPLIFKHLYTPYTFSEGTMSGCTLNYVFGGGPPANQIMWQVTGLASTTINWKFIVKRVFV